MRPMIGLAAIALCAPLFLSATSASAADTAPAARNYDCSKPGNANKTVCKTAAAKPMSAPAAKPAPAPAAAPAARNYDCSKAGNANKAVCKAAAAPAPKPAAPAPAAKPATMAAPKPAAPRPKPMVANGNARVVEWTTKTGKVVHYDCSKAGNFNKTACK